jgi:hypothetical protein
MTDDDLRRALDFLDDIEQRIRDEGAHVSADQMHEALDTVRAALAARSEHGPNDNCPCYQRGVRDGGIDGEDRT